MCLKGEAERAKQLHENEVTSIASWEPWLVAFLIHYLRSTFQQYYQAEEKPKNNLGDLARKMRLELELGEKKKREQEALALAKKDQEEEKIVKDATAVAEEIATQQVT